MAWNKKIREEVKKNRFIGGLILSFTVFLGLSFFSYNPLDPSLNSFGLSLKVTNYCGFAGSSAADLFYQIFGLSSWFFVFWGLLLSYKFFTSQFQEALWSSHLLFGLFLLAFSSLSELHLPQIVFFDEQVSLGGALGKIVIFGLKPLFHTIGTALILWSAFLLVFLFYGQVSFFHVFFILLRVVILFLKVLFKKAPTLMIGGFVKTKAFSFFMFGGLKTILFFFYNQFLKLTRWLFARQWFKGAPSLPIENGGEDLTEDATSQKEHKFIFKEAELLDEKEPDLKNISLKKFKQKDSEPVEPYLSEKVSTPLAAHSYAGSQLPSIDILSDSPKSTQHIHQKDVEILSKKLIDKLSQFSIKGEVTAVKTGPAVVLFEFKPEDHIKVSRIREMESDLSLALSSESVRIIAPIPGRDVVGIEASRPYREMVYLKTLLRTKDFMKTSLPLILGRRADNVIGIRDLARIPHLLVAGTTGSGKSIFVISFVTSLLFRHTPETLRILVVDPKQVDLSCFKDIPHLLAPIITSSHKTVEALHWTVMEMEKRYRSLAIFSARDHKAFNEKMKNLSRKEQQHHEDENEGVPPGQAYYFEPLPLICIVIEEFGDLMADKTIRRSVESAVVRLAQKARASGIHLVLAMQSPRKDVVTGLIKTNIPGRISFKVASGTDSRVILDEIGAEKLLSHGDMLFLEPGASKPFRYHGPFVREKDVAEVTKYWKSQGEPLYEKSLLSRDRNSGSTVSSTFDPEGMNGQSDSMYNEILEFVKTCDVVSASFLQRKFRIGYPRAARMIEILYEEGKIGPPQGSKARQVLINKQEGET